MLSRREKYLLLFASFLAGLVLSGGGCGPLADEFALPAAASASVPSELAPFQGKWIFDKLRLPGIEGEADDGPADPEEHALTKAMQQLGIGMTDIEIRGTQITQLGGILQAQYDLLDYSADGDKIVGKALWHEDRHDPGDASEIKVTLQRDGDQLIFTREHEEDGVTERFYFSR